MNGDKILLDSNIIVYLLGGDETLAHLLDSKTAYVSFITQLELLSYKDITAEETSKIREFLDQCIIVDINQEIKEKVISLRKMYSLKLPDSIIVATALYYNVPLISAERH